MLRWFRSLDQILRGEATHPEAIQDGHIELPRWGLVVVLVLLAMVYGACMGSYSLCKDIAPGVGQDSDRYLQLLASTIKIPALFLLTLVVTFPSLYVFNSLVGSRLRIASVLNLLIAALGVNLAVLASMGPIVAFFSVSTTSYAFMKLFNVAVMGFSGILGLLFLIQTLNRMSQRRFPRGGDWQSNDAPSSNSQRPDLPNSDVPDSEVRPDESIASESESDAIAAADDAMDALLIDHKMGALEEVDSHILGRHVTTVFRLWVIVFGLVGAQMGWVLRPFLGDPSQPFSWFRARESNVFEAIGQAIISFFQGG